MKIRPMLCGFLVALALLAGAELVVAHPLAPSLLDVREAPSGHTAVLWRRPVLLPVGAHPEPVLPARCRAVGPPAEIIDGPALVRRWTVDCGAAGWTGEQIAVSQLARAGSDVLLRVSLADGRTFQSVLRPAAPAFRLPALQSRTGVAASYLSLGVEHLLTGWDHLAFVLGLVLLVPNRRRLLGTITAFTLGHSVTLSLAALGFVRLPPAPLEAAIAASIFILALELSRDRPTVLGRRPWWMAAGFGLLHGLGFAGALAQVGLPAEEIPLALFSFNVGIELGQIAFVTLLLILGLALRPLQSRLPAWSAAVPTYCIGSLAAFWTLDRLLGLF
jgi:hydrogenase/urease accessory protein HupE